VSETLVAAMIADLLHMGYLSEVRSGCEAGACAGCSAHKAGACHEPGSAHLWAMTDAGRSAAG
jgi:hypothetical protein